MQAFSSLLSVSSLSTSSAVRPGCHHVRIHHRNGFTRNRCVSGWSPGNSPHTHQALWVETSPGYPDHHSDKPEQPCTVCQGQGKVACGTCGGIGRLNPADKRVLPRGVWPTWCNSCRGSGLWYCQRCMGTGVKRDPIGFHLPHMSDS